MAEAKQEDRKVQQIVPTRRKLAEHARAHHVVTVEDASHPEDFLKPDVFALVAKEMSVGDRVDVQDDGMTFFGEYLVVAADRNWAQLAKLREVKIAPVDEKPVDERFVVQYKGPHLKYTVIRKDDKAVVSENHQTRIMAEQWLLEHVRTIGRKAA